MRFSKNLAIIISLLLVIVSCDFLKDISDADIKKQLEESAAGINAPLVNVEVSDTISGIATPKGTLKGIKQGVPFRLNFSVNPNFGFLRWAAMMNDVELDRTQVEFSTPFRIETKVTVHINPGENKKVVIIPIGEVANNAKSFSVFYHKLVEDGRYAGLIPQNHYVQIQFSKPVNQKSIQPSGTYINGRSTEYTQNNEVYLQGIYNGVHPDFTVAFGNISIRGTINPPFGVSGIHLENFFYPPVLSADGRTMYLWTRTQDNGGSYFALHPFSDSSYPTAWADSAVGHYVPLRITIAIDGRLQDTSGLPMGISQEFSYLMAGNQGKSISPDEGGFSYTTPYQEPDDSNREVLPIPANEAAYIILEENTRSAVIDPSHLKQKGPENVLSLKQGDDQWVYILFQVSNSSYQIVGGRVLPVTYSENTYTANYFSPEPVVGKPGWVKGGDVPLLGEFIPGEQDSISPGDAALKEKLRKAYNLKIAGSEDMREYLPLVIIRYCIQNSHAVNNAFQILAMARVAGEGEPKGLPYTSASMIPDQQFASLFRRHLSVGADTRDATGAVFNIKFE